MGSDSNPNITSSTVASTQESTSDSNPNITSSTVSSTHESTSDSNPNITSSTVSSTHSNPNITSSTFSSTHSNPNITSSTVLSTPTSNGTEPTVQPKVNPSGSHMGGGAIFGIIVGVLFVTGIGVFFIVRISRKRSGAHAYDALRFNLILLKNFIFMINY